MTFKERFDAPSAEYKSVTEDLSRPDKGKNKRHALEQRVKVLLELLQPKSELLTLELCPGSYSNFTYLVEARTQQSDVLRIVVRLYAVFGSYDRGEKARREFGTLQHLARYGLPVPPPLYLDDTGEVLGAPGIVTRYVPGAQIESPGDPEGWARSLGTMLAALHAVPCGPNTDFLLDANAEATWFIRGEGVPDFMAAHPEGQEVWRVARDRWPRLERVTPTLVHLDYWLGNVLWERGQISAVVDWEEAAYGDPGIDVAYCRMDLFLRGLYDAADVFLDAYERKRGRVANLGFWQVAAAARPMFNPIGWISDAPAKERFAEFILDAKRRV